MNTPNHASLPSFSAALLAALLCPTAATASLVGPQPNCPPGLCRVSTVAKHVFQQRLAQAARDPWIASLQATGTAPDTLRLYGEISGQWENVDGYLSYTHDFTATFPDVGVLQVLLRGNGTRNAGNRYWVDWDRRVYWLDYDGGGPGIPHLLAALEFVDDYVPEAGDEFPEFNALPVVQASCTLVSPCKLNWSPYVLYRDPMVDYSEYPDGAAEADLLFVARADGEVVAVSLDLYDADGEPDGRTPLRNGDEIQFATIGYKLSEPGFVYIVEHMDFVTLSGGLRIELEHYIPGEDFLDPQLPPDFNAGSRRIKLLLDAQNGNDFAYGGPFELGFDWSTAPEFLFRGSMESLVPDGVTTAAP